MGGLDGLARKWKGCGCFAGGGGWLSVGGNVSVLELAFLLLEWVFLYLDLGGGFRRGGWPRGTRAGLWEP